MLGRQQTEGNKYVVDALKSAKESRPYRGKENEMIIIRLVDNNTLSEENRVTFKILKERKHAPRMLYPKLTYNNKRSQTKCYQ